MKEILLTVTVTQEGNQYQVRAEGNINPLTAIGLLERLKQGLLQDTKPNVSLIPVLTPKRF